MESNTAPQGFRRDENLDILPHVISLGDNGEIFSDGAFAKYRVDLEKDIIDSFRKITKDWPLNDWLSMPMEASSTPRVR